MNAELKELIQYRLSRSHETLTEAGVLVENECWAGAANRLYYAAFYAVNALLLSRGLASSKHTGVRAFFNRDFVHAKLISEASGETYNQLFQLRMRNDYEDFVEPDPLLIQESLHRTEALVREIESVLSEFL